MPKTKKQQVLKLVRKQGVLRPRDLDRYKIARVYLSRMCDEGLLKRVARGIYTLPETNLDDGTEIEEVCRQVPKGVISLISALEYHNLTTQIPGSVWVAIEHKARPPKITYPPIRLIRSSKKLFEYGVQIKKGRTTQIRVYSPAKTVADCFRFRNKVGLDVAIEALKDCRRKKAATIDELWEAAKVCRMSKVMKPYLEAVV
jgi:predicted transcriptional regulator of viral defense system